ncbi:hypothetical protein GTQ34_05700 [Muricauda sp. JGD-17]|uniref:Uncharacterized protein n=1 Tax=Flagellimonas ochracea TaxID=2696472 RepID=A0A964TAT0_9FLAO|nr:hypothetical protein [Allomuricauda ochracea]NAY91408.1 hypothetical protein [Allomuricauda ochracea]
MRPNLIQAIFLASILFVIEFAVKYVAFENSSVFFRIGPSICFWATALFFSLSIQENVKFRGRTTQTIKKKSSGYGIEIDYGIIVPENFESSPKYTFLFVMQMCIWIVNLVISQKVLKKFIGLNNCFSAYEYFLIGISILLTGYSIGAIISVLRNEIHD